MPWEKHSPRLGQDASSQTLLSLLPLNSFLIFATPSPCGALALIQDGLRRGVVVGSILIGMRATLSAPRWCALELRDFIVPIVSKLVYQLLNQKSMNLYLIWNINQVS